MSVIYLTYRPGGYDMLVDGLRRQTFRNYELICVDEWAERRNIVWDYLRENGIPVSHITPSKEKCFPELPFNLINAYNTGVLLSKGEIIVILNDYTWLPPKSLEKTFLRVKEQGDMTAVSNSAYCFNCKAGSNMTHPISIWKTPWSGQPQKGDFWVGIPFELFYTAISHRLLQEINGFPECYDYHKANQVAPLVRKIREAGGQLYVDMENTCYHAGHRDWGGELWHQSKRKEKTGKLIERENCFNLKTHMRGTLP